MEKQISTMKKLGKGTFTTAYLLDDNTVLLKSVDPIKECMSMGWFPDSPLFPEVNRADNDNEYTMKYYPRVSSLKNTLDSDQYDIYKLLRDLFVNGECNDYGTARDYHYWYNVFSNIENEELSEVLCHALDACSNYGSDIAFEISPRNVAVDNGKLVLLDCFFVISALEQIRFNK